MKFETDWPQIDRMLTWLEDHAREDSDVASLFVTDPEAVIIGLYERVHPHRLRSWCEAGVAAARQLGRRRIEHCYWTGLGHVATLTGDFRQAAVDYRQALNIARETGDQSDEAYSLRRLGATCCAQQEASRAIEYFEQALQIDRASKNRHEEGVAVGGLGEAHGLQGDLRRAIDLQGRQRTTASLPPLEAPICQT